MFQAWQQAARCFETGRFDASLDICLRLLAHDRRNVDLLHLAALSSMRLGDHSRAVQLQKKALKGRPGDAALLTNLANMYLETGRWREALAQFRKADAARPGVPAVLQGMITCLVAIDRPRGPARHHSPELEEVVALSRRLLAATPDDQGARRRLADTLYALERFDEAEAVLRDMLETGAEREPTLLSLASVLIDGGRFDEARAICEGLLADDPANPSACLTLSTIDAGAVAPATAEAIGERLARRDLPPRDRAALEFVIGRRLDARDDADAAFPHFAAANAALLEADAPDLEAEIEKIDDVRRGFAGGLGAGGPGGPGGTGGPGGHDSAVPVFVVGMPRSGTSLVEQILASHPRVAGCGELGDLSILAAELAAKGRFPDGAGKLTRRERREIGARYVSIVRGYAPDAERIVDKAPHNFLFIGLLRLVLPNAAILHCRRDPVATCFSNYIAPFSHLTGVSNDLRALGRYYRRYESLMAHWHAILPEGAILDVVYEDLVDDPEPVIACMLDHCGLPWDDRCLAFHETRRKVRTASATQVRRPLMAGRSEYWRRYEKHLAPLIEALEDGQGAPSGGAASGEGPSGKVPSGRGRPTPR
jgi:tetratricopeptide (TPR) repeat protein